MTFKSILLLAFFLVVFLFLTGVILLWILYLHVQKFERKLMELKNPRYQDFVLPPQTSS